MKLISVRCNHCGAPLEVPPTARFVTCGFCDAQLVVHHSGSAHSTELLEEIKATTDGLVEQVEQLKHREEVEQLDRQWEITQRELQVHGKDGRVSVPSKGGAIFGTVIATVFGFVWMLFAGSIVARGMRMGLPSAAALFPLFGLVFIVIGIAGGLLHYSKAQRYEQAKAQYQRRRRAALGLEDPRRIPTNEVR
ncbi:hypothetical protein [Roseimaritima sediminicola]|uniref:hypothetical protein n=1 Tax=Roseimaritima sediminicola TaxID=2662066 RepID=UPI00129854D3|nr:hypothetical protein [Roseimaritima sediminicola]